MNRSIVLFSLVALCVSGAFFSCKCVKKKKRTSDTEVASTVLPLRVSPDFRPEKNDSLTVTGAKVKGDILTLFVHYGGGCETHEFSLNFDGMYLKSMPPKANLLLVHDAKDDRCRSIVYDTLQFNVREARYPGTEKGEVLLRINGYKEELSYKY